LRSKVRRSNLSGDTSQTDYQNTLATPAMYTQPSLYIHFAVRDAKIRILAGTVNALFMVSHEGSVTMS